MPLKKISKVSIVLFIVIMCVPILNRSSLITIIYMIPISVFWIINIVSALRYKLKIDLLEIIIYTFLVIALMYRIFGKSTAPFYNYGVLLIFWNTFFMYKYMEKWLHIDELKRINYFFITFFLINIVQNTIVLIFYPDASRGVTGSSAMSLFYQSLNMGDTNFVFASMLLSLVFLSMYREFGEKKNLVIFFILVINQLQSARTTTLLIFVGGIILYYILVNLKKLHRIIKYIGVMILLFLGRILFSEIDKILQRLANHISNISIKERLILLSQFASDGDASGITRLQLYEISLTTFINHPFLGIGEHPSQSMLDLIGEHSELFDCLASYGSIGGIFWITFYVMYYKKFIKPKKGFQHYEMMLVIYICTIIYSSVNNIVGTGPFAIILFIVLPNLYLLDYNQNKKRKNY